MEKRGNVELIFNFDSSGTLKTQIQEGADCDIFISAGQKQMDQLDASAGPDVNTEGLDFVLPDTRVDLRLSGPRTDIFGMSREDIRIQVDLSSISAAGTYTRGLNIYYADDVDSSKISVDSQSRSAVTVQVSTMYSKTVDVKVDVVNNEVAEEWRRTKH